MSHTLCMPRSPIIMNVDKPFFYKIIYKNHTIFAGRIVNPLES